MTTEPSGRLYSVVTQYWPRLATGFIATLGVVELVLGGLTSDSSVELYLTAWAATTGGVWFLFEKAEQALGEESRSKVVGWVAGTDLTSGIESVPEQFRSLFDRAFGERQLSLKCFVRSSVASVIAVIAVLAFWMIALVPDEYEVYLGSGESPVHLTYRVDWIALLKEGWGPLLTAVLFSTLFNLVPDFLSLWETRAVTRWISSRKKSLTALLTADFFFTAGVSAASVMGALYLVLGIGGYGVMPRAAGDALPAWIDAEMPGAAAMQRLGEVVTLRPNVGQVVLPSVPTITVARRPQDLSFDEADVQERLRGDSANAPDGAPRSRSLWWKWPYYWSYSGDLVGDIQAGKLDVTRHSGEYDGEYVPFGIFFYSAFATSVWLWLHAGAVLLSQALLRMNSGVGFLLRVTDVERQPFRSMGFVSVLIVSFLFALGLPLVVL